MSKNELKMFIVCVLSFIPVGLLNNKIARLIWYGAMFISFVPYAIKLLKKKEKTRKGIFLMLFLYQFVQFIMSLINGAEVLYSFCTMLIISLMGYLFENLFLEYKFSFLKSFDYALLFVIIAESFCFLLGTRYLLSFASTYIYYAIWFAIHSVRCHKESKPNYLLYAVSLVLIILTIIKPDMNSDGTKNYEWTFYIIVFIACLEKFIRPIFIKLKNDISVFITYFIIGAFNIYFVLLQSQIRIPFVTYIIENVMHKSLTFSGRLPIWRLTVSFIKKRPLIGYGSGFPILKGDEDYWVNWLGIYGPHNQFLAVALAGGIITLLIYLVMIIMSTLNLRKLKDRAYTSILSCGFFLSFIELSLTYRNMLNCIPLFILIIVAYNMVKIERCETNE